MTITFDDIAKAQWVSGVFAGGEAGIVVVPVRTFDDFNWRLQS